MKQFFRSYKLQKGDMVVRLSNGERYLCESLEEAKSVLTAKLADYWQAENDEVVLTEVKNPHSGNHGIGFLDVLYWGALVDNETGYEQAEDGFIGEYMLDKSKKGGRA